MNLNFQKKVSLYQLFTHKNKNDSSLILQILPGVLCLGPQHPVWSNYMGVAILQNYFLHSEINNDNCLYHCLLAILSIGEPLKFWQTNRENTKKQHWTTWINICQSQSSFLLELWIHSIFSLSEQWQEFNECCADQQSGILVLSNFFKCPPQVIEAGGRGQLFPGYTQGQIPRGRSCR